MTGCRGCGGRKFPKGKWQVNGKRLVYLNFSGISMNVPGSFSKRQNRFNAENLGVMAELCDRYRHLVLANKWEAFSKPPHGFGYFADGRRLDDTMRHWPPAPSSKATSIRTRRSRSARISSTALTRPPPPAVPC